MAGPQPPGRLDLPRIPGALPHDRTSPAHRPGSLQRRFGDVLARELIRVTVAAPGLGDPVRRPASSLTARHPLTMRHEPDEQPTPHRLTANSKAPDQTRPESRERLSGTTNRTHGQLRGPSTVRTRSGTGPPPTPFARCLAWSQWSGPVTAASAGAARARLPPLVSVQAPPGRPEAKHQELPQAKLVWWPASLVACATYLCVRRRRPRGAFAATHAAPGHLT